MQLINFWMLTTFGYCQLLDIATFKCCYHFRDKVMNFFRNIIGILSLGPTFRCCQHLDIATFKCWYHFRDKVINFFRNIVGILLLLFFFLPPTLGFGNIVSQRSKVAKIRMLSTLVPTFVPTFGSCQLLCQHLCQHWKVDRRKRTRSQVKFKVVGRTWGGR